MRNRILKTGCLAVMVMALQACENKASKKVEADPLKEAAMRHQDINPNGMSELSALMEDIYMISKKWKEAVEKGEDLGIYPAIYDQLKTAEPTNENIKNETYDPFADDFVVRTKALLSAPENEKKTAFDLYVDGCMNCHNTMCTGPIKRIKLLRIKE